MITTIKRFAYMASRLAPAVVLLGLAAGANAQLLYSFESGLDGFIPQGAADSDYINHQQSTIGATDGTMALEIETGSGFGRDVVVNEGSGPIYDIFNTVAADPSQFTLACDVTFTQDGWDRVESPGSFFQINVFSNSDSLQGFQESFGVANGNPGSPSFVQASMPASAISLVPDSSFFQLGFGTNGNHTAGLGGEGVQYYIDNIRFSPVPTFIEETLFSWETPDDPGTPGINEQFEGWVDGFGDQPYFHTRTITNDGVTDGASALQFNSPQAGFSWGSQFVLDSSVETGLPELQPLIDDLIGKVNGAEKIAFDVTFTDDQFPGVPTFLSLFVNISDSSGTFYQTPAKQAGNPVTLAEQTITIEIPISEFSAGGQSLADNPLQSGEFFRIALATNSDDANSFIIDNFRVLSLEGQAVDGDFNGDGLVDNGDLNLLLGSWGSSTVPPEWVNGFEAPVDNEELNALLGNWGFGTGGAVPEPTALLSAGLLSLLAAPRRRLG